MVTYPSKKRYDAKNILRVTVGFNRNVEPDSVKALEEEENRSQYIKRLVREDVERRRKK